MRSLILSAAALLALAPSALATNVGAELTNIAGKTPVYNLDLPEGEIVRLVKEIESTGWIGNAEISIDSLRHRGDKTAYDKAVEIMAKRMQWAIFELSELKRNVIRYSVIVNQVDLSGEKVALITSTSSKITQNNYFRAMWSLAGAVEEEAEALSQCVSEVCVIEVSEAFEALTRFTESIDRDLDFRKLSASKELFWRFDKPLLRASFSKAFRSIVPNNQDHNAYKLVVAGLFAPISVVGTTTVDLLKAAGSAIFNPRYRKIKLEVDEVKINFDKVRDKHREIFTAHYQDTANGGRLKQWEEKERERQAQEEAAKKLEEQHAAAEKAAKDARDKTPGDPMKSQDYKYWFKIAKGKSDTEKEACAKMAVLSAEKYDGLMRALKVKTDKVALQFVEVQTFAASLNAKQITDAKSYVDSYAAFVAGGKTVSELSALDDKLRSYVWDGLRDNFVKSQLRFRKSSCPDEKYSYRYTDGAYNTDPVAWALQKEGECSYTYNSYWNSRYYQWGNATELFLSVAGGKVMFWACTRVSYDSKKFSSCSSYDVAKGVSAGLTFEDAIRPPMLPVEAQAEKWMSQTKDEFVSTEIPACF
jgi:hypothetical protein